MAMGQLYLESGNFPTLLASALAYNSHWLPQKQRHVEIKDRSFDALLLCNSSGITAIKDVHTMIV